jgi:hypothetical protein
MHPEFLRTGNFSYFKDFILPSNLTSSPWRNTCSLLQGLPKSASVESARHQRKTWLSQDRKKNADKLKRPSRISNPQSHFAAEGALYHATGIGSNINLNK